jgi:ATP-dependent Clp protease adaptor protein ClpS
MSQTEIQIQEKVRHIPMYKVLIHNDPVTTFQFVVYILMYVFSKDINAAWSLADEVHRSGVGLAGVYSLEHAEHLVDIAASRARSEKFPLTFSIEPD